MALIPNPNFPVITCASWNETPLAETESAIQSQTASLVAAGKTDGIYDIPDPSAVPRLAYRNWLDTDSANVWIAFLTGTNDPGLAGISIVVP